MLKTGRIKLGKNVVSTWLFWALLSPLCRPAPPPAQIIPLELLWLMPTLSFVASSLDHSDLLRLTGQGWQGMAVQVGQRRTKKVGLGRGESCKLLRHLGTRCPVGLRTSSRILRATSAFFVVTRIFAVTYALFGYFLGQFSWFSTFLGQFWSFLGQFWTFSNRIYQ